MKRTLIALLFTAAFALPSRAQQINFDFPALEAKASEVVDVTLDGKMLRLAGKFLGDDAEERATRDMIKNLQGIYVRSYEFEHEGEYDRAVIERVRAQIGPGWQKIVNVRSKLKENVEVYTQSKGEQITGLVVISAEPTELTLVQIMGPIDLDRLSDLEGHMGIPKIDAKESK